MTQTADVSAALDDLDATTNRLVDGLIAQRDEARKALADAREAFLSLIADARRWDEDVDGEYHTDSAAPTITVCYFAEFDERGVRDLVEALGIPVRFDDLADAAIQRALKAA